MKNIGIIKEWKIKCADGSKFIANEREFNKKTMLPDCAYIFMTLVMAIKEAMKLAKYYGYMKDSKMHINPK